ncbi:MAG: LAGLIDADG family homing endonuclease [Candidatus Aenigmarchaeota archaeon]|nr:LAGLIDADG family homing endonuclease [Candidatus Aenigmarchaeota archaeon]
MKRIGIPKERLKSLYLKEFKSSIEIARIYKCDKKTILNRLKEFGIKPRYLWRKPGISRFIINRIDLEDLYHSKNFTIYNIAKIYNCSPYTIGKRMKECGINVRDRRIIISRNILRKLYVDKKLTGEKIARMYNCSVPTIIKLLRKYGIEIRTHSEAVNIHEKKDFKNDPMEKSYIIGFALGDLNVFKPSINGELIVARCGTTKNEQVILFKKLFEKYGHINERHRFYKGKHTIELWASLNTSFGFILNKKDDIKQWILDNDRYFLAFLAGYIDAEGNIGIAKRRKSETYIKIESYDGNVLCKIQTKLCSMGISCPYPKAKIRIRHNKPLWSLRISSHLSVIKLLEELIPIMKHAKRINDAKIALENTKLFAKFYKKTSRINAKSPLFCSCSRSTEKSN